MLRTLPFHDTVNASSEKTVVSDRLNFPYTIKKITIGFALGCDRLLRIKVFISNDPTAPTSGEPTGDNVFTSYGQVEYIVGDDATIVIESDYVVEERGTYIKVYANNLDSFNHTIDVRVLIDIPNAKEEAQS